MIKKISSAKDLELDQMQSKMEAFEGESVHACIHALMINVVSLFSICAYTFELSLFINISLLSWLNGIDKFISIVCMHGCMLALQACV